MDIREGQGIDRLPNGLEGLFQVGEQIQQGPAK